MEVHIVERTSFQFGYLIFTNDYFLEFISSILWPIQERQYGKCYGFLLPID